MKTIKFSHKYNKLAHLGCEDGDDAMLLHVIEERYENIGKIFAQYDCAHPKGAYKLPIGGHALILIFQHQGGNIFTTIRSVVPSHKSNIYRESVGEIFKISIK